MTRVETVFQVSMPKEVASLLKAFDQLTLNIDGFELSLGCIQLGYFFDQLLIIVMAPWVLGLLIIGCSVGAEVVYKRKAASLKAGLIRALPYFLWLLFVALPTVFSRAFQALDCEDFDDGTRFLRGNYALKCNSVEYERVEWLAWTAIGMYPVCIQLFYLALLLSARKAIITELPTNLSRSLAFLHQDYEPSFFWWEIIETFKKARSLHAFNLTAVLRAN